MPKTAQEEAWEENFVEDVERVAKEILVNLKDSLPRDWKRHFYSRDDVSCITLYRGEETIELYLTPTPPENPKINGQYGLG